MAIEPAMVRRCEDYAKRVGAKKRKVDYAAHKSAVAGGQDKIAQISEVGMAYFTLTDPEDLDWGYGPGGDLGYDVINLAGTKIDVKASENPYAQYAIWPPKQVPRFDGKDFDFIAFVRVRVDPDEWAYCDFVGCVPKARFKKDCERNNKKFEPGSWVMKEDFLEDMILMREKSLPWC
jgi:hypothetical protein